MASLAPLLDQRLRQAAEWTSGLRRDRTRAAWSAPARVLIDFLVRGVGYLWRNHRYLTTVKLANYLLVGLQFKLKTERVVGRPVRMKIESTNICNTQCQLCPTGIGLQGRPKGKMAYDDYRRLIDKLSWHLMAVDLSMWGDPMIVPDIFKMIRYAHDKGVWTYISSNLHAFKAEKDHAAQLVDSGLDLLTCSLHGASQRSYEAYQPGKQLHTITQRIEHILATRERLGATTPDVQLNFVVTRQNESEVESFTRLARDLGCRPVFSAPALNTRFVGRNKNLVDLGLSEDVKARRRRQLMERWLPKDGRYVLEPYRRMLEEGADDDPQRWNGYKLLDCSWPWLSSVVNWDGQVVTCCGSFDPSEDMGNVLEQGLGRIWNGSKYRAARRSFRRKVDADQAENNPCASCPGFML